MFNELGYVDKCREVHVQVDMAFGFSGCFLTEAALLERGRIFVGQFLTWTIASSITL